MSPFCFVHTDVRAVDACRYCGRQLCERCGIRDVVSEVVFCSVTCRDQSPAGPASKVDFQAGEKKPFLTGWRLWAHSLSSLVPQTLPVALVIGTAFWLGADPSAATTLVEELPEEAAEPILAPWATAVVLAAFVYGIALTGVILSRRYTGQASGNPWAQTARRIVPWMLTWFLVLVATLVGLVALIVPGIYIGIRLFWADELALMHRLGPLSALEESWELTRDRFGAVFVFQFLSGMIVYPVVFFLVVLYVVLIVAMGSVGLGSILPSGTLGALLFFVGYALFHAPELAKFYAMRARSSGATPREGTPEAAPNTEGHRFGG